MTIYGDLNNNGVIDTGDVTLIIRHLSGVEKLTSEQLKRADVDGDGKVTEVDRDMIMNCVVGNTPIGKSGMIFTESTTTKDVLGYLFFLGLIVFILWLAR